MADPRDTQDGTEREGLDTEAIAARVEAMTAAADHGNRRGFRGRGPWTGVAWEIGTGIEVGDCGHRHKVSTDEARNCPGLDRFDPIEVVTVRRDELLTALTAAASVRQGELERLREVLRFVDQEISTYIDAMTIPPNSTFYRMRDKVRATLAPTEGESDGL